MQIKISVIIPIYNVEEYLEECLDSVISQTLQEIEIICINDGSPDNSLAILERYAAKDKRVHVLSQNNQGQGAARNRGLEEATGKYVYFMDSDDYLTEITSLQIMYEVIDKNGLDMLSFNFKRVGIIEEIHICDIAVHTIMDGKEYMQEEGVLVMPWLRLLRRGLLEDMDDIYLPYIRHDDAEFFPRLCCTAKKVEHIEDVLIAWRQREGSLTWSKLTQAKIDGLFAIVKTYVTLGDKEHNKEASEFLHKRGVLYLFELYKKVLSEKNIEDVYYQQLFRECGFSALEVKLLENEERFIKSVEIEGEYKLSNPWVYYVRRFRIYYFKHIRKYGSK